MKSGSKLELCLLQPTSLQIIHFPQPSLDSWADGIHQGQVRSSRGLFGGEASQQEHAREAVASEVGKGGHLPIDPSIVRKDQAWEDA